MNGPPPRAALASMRELHDPAFRAFMSSLDAFARWLCLRESENLSKAWEYPWLWFGGLGRVGLAGTRVVDIGSQLSPMPWAMAVLGARVTLVETDPRFVPIWARIRDRLGVAVSWAITDPRTIPLDAGEAEILTSFSVIEHQEDKVAAVNEAARVLRPGGLLALSFDICEPHMGMEFPSWNGRALSLREFEDVVWRHPAFAPPDPPFWNTGDIPEFLAWHRTTAPHHTYIVGAAVLRRRS